MELLKRTQPSKLTTRVLQFGEGNFLRGFVDWMIDRLNKENGGDYGDHQCNNADCSNAAKDQEQFCEGGEELPQDKKCRDKTGQP